MWKIQKTASYQDIMIKSIVTHQKTAFIGVLEKDTNMLEFKIQTNVFVVLKNLHSLQL